MRDTRVLGHFIKELKNKGFIRYDKDFLNYVDIPHEIVTAKQLSGFIKREGDIHNKLFLKKIELFFDLPETIWTSNEKRQLTLIDTAIKHKIYLQSLPKEDALDISSIIPIELPCTENQSKLLETFAKITTQIKLETMIDEFLSTGLLNKTVENQYFLVKLLELAYKKGLYTIILEFIAPNLYKKQYDNVEIQKYLAHTYGSLKKYDEAQQILSILIDHSTIENINLRTSALSNHKREMFENENNLIKEDKLYVLIQGYQELHAINGIYSYYTGINLLYMVVIGQILFPSDSRYDSIDTQKIYELSKSSLKEDNTHNDYYVKMSEFEFQLLLDREGVLEKIESFLDDYRPHVSLVERTLRQMRLFIDKTQKSHSPVVDIFEKTIDTLASYCKYSKET